VSARDVPAVLAHVEKLVEAMAPGDRVRYRPLCEVLRVAAARGLGYWRAPTSTSSRPTRAGSRRCAGPAW